MMKNLGDQDDWEAHVHGIAVFSEEKDQLFPDLVQQPPFVT